MSFEIIQNIEIPQTTHTRTRSKGIFHQTLDRLEIGEGFTYDSKGTLKSQYPKVAPAKFPGKKFKVWEVRDENGEIVPGKFGVARIATE